MTIENVFLTHYDLDAVGTYIIAKHAFKPVAFKCQGYPKVDKSIDWLIENHSGKNIVVADLCLSVQQVALLTENFNQVTYFDHHQESKEILNMVDSNLWFNPGECNLEVIYHDNLCATALIFQYWIQKLGGKPSAELSHFAQVVEVYDNWRLENDLWDEAYALNELFWKESFFGFMNTFANGFLELNGDQQLYVDMQKKKKIDMIEEAPKLETEKGSIIYLFESAATLNDITLLCEPNNHYMIYKNKPELPFSLSVRTNLEGDINIGAAMEKVREKFDFVEKGGGHEYAGGSSFYEGTTVEQICEYIEAIDQNL